MSTEILLVIVLLGTTIVVALLVKSGLESIGLPSLVGYVTLGFVLRLVDSQWGLLSIEAQKAYELLSDIGIICLLFEVGLKSNVAGLIKQLRRASTIWISNVLFSGILGYSASYFLLSISWIPSLFISVALTATSVGVSVAQWREAHALSSPDGELVIDVAELDDLSGIVLMAMLFAVAQVLKGGIGTHLLPGLAQTSALLLSKMVIFAAFCLLFSRYVEHPITTFFQKIEPPPDSMIMVAGIGFIIAALAGLLGFSTAIGAFFAGLIYSRDPQAVKMEASFTLLYEFFTPFFFIGVGLEVDPKTLTTALGLGAVLLMVKLLTILAELIVAPLIVSRVLRLSRVLPALEKHRGIAVNWGFFLVVYTIIGLNRDAFLGQPLILVRVSAIAFTSTFILTYLINYVAKLLGVSKPDRLSLILLGTRKNYGMATAVCLTFFSARAAIPTAAAIAFAIAQFIWLTFTVKKMG
jgi:Kef-type K+ transport system membrane component KefB